LIFLTVGTQLPFDRLVFEVDQWAEQNKQIEIFGQIGSALYKPTNFQHTDFLSINEVETYVKKADLIISHAGMGTFLTALKYNKALVIVPRRADLGEHRSNHQLTTARWLNKEYGIDVAYNTSAIEAFLGAPPAPSPNRVGEHAQPELIDRLKEFIFKP
jgi:exopolysaccharide biosynthesis glucuronosyltransferase PssE